MGYYSLTDNPVSIYAGAASSHLKEGDEIVVQVAKDGVRSKDPVLTSNLSFTGRYAVLTAGKTVIGFSAKIHDSQWKEQMRPQLQEILQGKAGIIVRTNAYERDEHLLEETAFLMRQMGQLLETARFRTCHSLLYQSEPDYVKTLCGCPAGSLEAIVTDDAQAYETIRSYLQREQPQNLEILRFYQDPMVGMAQLYSLEHAMEQACQKRVWLKSGGYLIIEPTEAMVVIDVNSGKYSGKKKLAETIRLINLEAAEEICHQLRLRNLSGIIVVDFIDMDGQEDKDLVMNRLRTCSASDPMKVDVIDMTPLNLVEMTRKKGKRPLWEQISRSGSQ